MLHIILLILKIIAMILGCILGLAVLLICAVLFVSVKYRGNVAYDDQCRYRINCCWIPVLTDVRFLGEGKKFRLIFRIFGFPLIDTAREKKIKAVKSEDFSSGMVNE